MTTSGHNVGLEEEKPMNDTPRTDAAWKTTPSVYDFIVEMKRIERELNAANIEIEERRKDVVWLATEKAKSENYVTELENRLRALWDKLEYERKHYMEQMKRTESFINRFLDPEDLGYVVNSHVRDDAREALGRERVETKL